MKDEEEEERRVSLPIHFPSKTKASPKNLKN
jgi:hypothetical protein